MEGYLGLVSGSISVIIIYQLLLKLFLILSWRPYVVTKKYREQGIVGPRYKFVFGCFKEILSLKSSAAGITMDINSHDFTPRIYPHFLKWMSIYGRTFLFWFGPKPLILISDMDLVKKVLFDKSGFYEKPDLPLAVNDLLGKGLPLMNGPDWVRHRRVIKPAFHIDKLKEMTKQMTLCTESMVEVWGNQIAHEKNGQFEIELRGQFQELTADIIAQTAFGWSYMKGKKVVSAQKKLQEIAYASIFQVQVPGLKYLPTNNNRTRWKLEKIVRTNLVQIIHERMESRDGGYGNDLLGILLETCMGDRKGKNNYMSLDEITNECKTFFFAGHDSTSLLLTWTVFYLSTNHEWQERLRDEVLRECGTEAPNADMLSKLKLVNLVLLEVLRLYTPAGLVGRTTSQDMELGNIKLLKGTTVVVPISILHRDKDIWGQDADKFNPLRFENGLSKAAKHPNAFLSFAGGPRVCIGQTFAMLQAKIVISMLLQRFSFVISPNYMHKPTETITLHPASGVQVIVKPLQN
ncbi:Cytochrome P450 [Rhynchospora pubera]|uniref:Cytochrome P450 n=1 Tax=Rhynchospora pubera TaxID=906938 RepID=A0AAV8DZW8_9POAL|nr:Cytochrome P450 [Rhynchospora pubera]